MNDGDAEDLPFDPETGRLVSRFIDTAANLAWFAHIGEALTQDLRREAEAYVSALGFPDCGLARITDWREAARAAESRDLDSPGFEAEEQLRAGLTASAVERHGEDAVEVMLTHLAAVLSPVARDAARNAATLWGVRSRPVTDAAAGAALQACHQAALILIAGEADEHAFALRFKLFERGRWPIGITGSTFNLF